MENAEEILQSLDEFSKVKPKDIPAELEGYLCFVAKTGDPIYQWPLIKCLFREKLINVITDFYEQCPSVEIPPCPNVDAFNYDSMKTFILEKLDTFAAAPFTVQRICELLTTPRKEYNRIDKYMRALEKNILVVSTKEPGNRRTTENGESVVNGLENEHLTPGIINSDINVEVDMDDASVWPKTYDAPAVQEESQKVQDTFVSESKEEGSGCRSTMETVITSRPLGYMNYTQTETISASNDSAHVSVETTAVLTAPADNITVKIRNVTEEEINHLAEQDQQAQTEGEPPIFVSSINHKDTSVYLGTNENGDRVYRIKYEPYVEIDYMALPLAAFQPDADTAYDNTTIKPETSQPINPPETSTEVSQPTNEPQSSTVETEPDDNAEPSESTTEDEKTNWEVTNSTDPVISSSDEVVETVAEEKTGEDEVTESNIEGECLVSQTEDVQEVDVDQAEDEAEAVAVVEMATTEEAPAAVVPEEAAVEVTQSVEVSTAEENEVEPEAEAKPQPELEPEPEPETTVPITTDQIQEPDPEPQPEPPFEPMELDKEIFVSEN